MGLYAKPTMGQTDVGILYEVKGMNERIKQLVKDAGAVPIHGKPRDRALVGFDNIEKFAELIVRECMNQIEEVRQIKAGHPTPDYEQGMNDGMFVAIRTIEEHFGV
jgi:hypothetical protein